MQRSDSSDERRQILAIFSNLFAPILVQNSVKGHRVTNIVEEIDFEMVRDELESTNQEQFSRDIQSQYIWD